MLLVYSIIVIQCNDYDTKIYPPFVCLSECAFVRASVTFHVNESPPKHLDVTASNFACA